MSLEPPPPGDPSSASDPMNLAIRLSLCALALHASLAAQRTWVVDSAGRPGTDFTGLQPAVDAARSGDTVLVRYDWTSTYRFGATVSKGLRIVGEPDAFSRRPQFDAVIVVRNLPAGELVVLEELEILGRHRTNTAGLELRNNAGGVVVARVEVLTPVVPGNPATQIENCAQVSLDELAGGAVSVRGSTVMSQRLRLDVASNSYDQTLGIPAIRLVDSVLTLSDNFGLHGSRSINILGSAWSNPGPTLDLLRSKLVVSPRVEIVAGAAANPQGWPVAVTPAIRASQSELRIDLSAGVRAYHPTVSNPAPIVTDVPVVGTRVPEVRFGPELFPGQLDIHYQTASVRRQGTLVLLAGMPAPPTWLPDVGLLGVDPASSSVIAAQSLAGSTSFLLRLPIPTLPLGTPVTFQTASLTPDYGFRLGAPVSLVLP